MTQDKELEKRYKKEFRGHIFAMDDALMNWMLQFIQKQVALGQGVTGIGIQVARQVRHRVVRHPVVAKPPLHLPP